MRKVRRIDQMTIKESNKQNLLNGFEKNDYLTISDMIEKTGLTSVTSNAIIKELLAEKWIIESHLGESSGGRKPMVYKFNEDRNNLLQISISKKSIYLTIVNLRKKVLVTTYKDIKIRGNDELKSAIQSLLNQNDVKEHLRNILAISINVPGVIDQKESVLLYSSPLNVKNFDFDSCLNETLQTDVPVYVFKRVEGLLLESIAKDKRTIKAAYILVDDGLGLSVTSNSDSHSAMREGSELGHLVVKTEQGKTILGDLFRDEYLLDLYNSLNQDDPVQDFKRLVEVLSGKEDLSKNSYIRKMEEDIALVCANVINLFAPEKLVVGGVITELLSEERLRESVDDYILRPFKENLSISTASISYDKLIDGTINFILNEHVFKLLF